MIRSRLETGPWFGFLSIPNPLAQLNLAAPFQFS